MHQQFMFRENCYATYYAYLQPHLLVPMQKVVWLLIYILLFNCIQHFPLSFTYNSAISCWTFNSGSLLSVFTSVDKSININPNLWWLANYYHLTVYNGIIMKTDRKIESEKKTEGGNA